MKRPALNSIISIFIIIAVSSANIYAQTSINYTGYLVKDDNAFKNREAYDEWINNSTLLLGHQFSGENYSLQGFYSVNFLRYNNNNDLSNFRHIAGFSGELRNYFENDYTLDFSGYVKFNQFKDRYDYYNANGYDINISIKNESLLTENYSFGLSMTQDRYDVFTDIDNNSYNLWGKYQRFFRSKLSLSGEASFAVKKYVNQNTIEYFGYYRYTEEPILSSVVSLSGTLGKSITPTLGVNLGVGGKLFVGDPIQVYSNGIYYYTENDLYDDPFSYEDHYVSINLTKQFAVGFQSKIGIKFQSKDYAGTPALDENGDLIGKTREDSRNEYSLITTKKFNTGIKFPGEFTVFLNYMYRNNPSNDPYYNFKDNVVLVGFSVGI
ncbi:surface lipoprotein assembly modifier [Candidatus Latescibacterota bacterium]